MFKRSKVLGTAKRLAFIVLGLAAIAITARTLSFCWPLAFIGDPARENRERRVKLLSQADHKALLKAGREVLRQAQVEQDPNTPMYSLPKGVKIPAVIRNLLDGHGGISYYHGCLTIAMFGGWDDYGVTVYPEDFTPPHVNFKYGDYKLLEGLWYYDENYRWGEEYDREVRALVASNKTRKGTEPNVTPKVSNSQFGGRRPSPSGF